VVLHQNAVPVFADLDRDTFQIDVECVRALVTERTKAIIPVALYGMSPDMDPLMALAREHDIAVIEDCAECYLGEYKGRLVGTIGDMASFSFQGSKHMTCGDGGIVITDDPDYALGIRHGMCFGFSSLAPESAPTTAPPREIRQDPNFARHIGFGWNYRLPELCAAAALGQLERLDDLVGWRQAVAAGYAEVVAGCEWLSPQKEPEDQGIVNSLTWHQFRDQYVEFGGDPIYGAWRPVYLEPVFQEEAFYGKGCPNHCPLYEGTPQKYAPGLCPVCESIQPRLFQFRTNYDRERAERQFQALAKTVAHFEGKN
jgi:perosamine synthetase